MRIFTKTLLWILGLLTILVFFLFLLGYGYILKGFKTTYLSGHTTAYIEDYPKFSNRKIPAGTPQPWPLHSEYNSVRTTKRLQEINQDLQTISFLIIKNDSIWYEEYSEDFGPNSKTNSFSMAKSITAAMLGRAIFEGEIKSLDQPVADFFPQFDERLTVGDLASMSSGLNWNENYYNPFSMTAEAYFGENIRKLILQLEVTEKPGAEFEYLSGNTQLLGMVIEKATGKSLSTYLSESFWKPLGMRNNGLWQLDSEESGMEKAYCCIASNARNFARFGKLYKDFGKWQGKPILDSAFVAKSIRPRFEDSPHYGYGFWLEEYKAKDIFYMRGILGQYVIVIPEDNVIISRLGKEKMSKPAGEEHSRDFYLYLEEVYKMLNQPLH